jgi:hypothetical protein
MFIYDFLNINYFLNDLIILYLNDFVNINQPNLIFFVFIMINGIYYQILFVDYEYICMNYSRISFACFTLRYLFIITKH